jgi:predicted dehydrogenase
MKAGMFTDFIAIEHPEVPAGVDALTSELNEFLECVRRGTAPRVDGRAGLSALEVADRVVESVRSSNRPMLRVMPQPVAA